MAKKDEQEISIRNASGITTAALRAAKAWSVRSTEPGAWREISRMHGVMLSFLPPGQAPSTPVKMIKKLQRPMREWASLPWDGLPDELGTFAILDKDNNLTEDAIEYGSDYTEALFENHSEESRIPQWAHQAFEKQERDVYRVLISAGQREYAVTRRMLVEVPAGLYDTVASEIHNRGALHTGAYIDIPPDQQFSIKGKSWYSPCPECRWPMHVKGGTLRCRYPQHPGLFRFRPGQDSDETPKLSGPVETEVHSAESAVCLHEAVWRYITVPGVTEVHLMDWLTAQKGINEDDVDPWPGKDSWDITVRAGREEFQVDLKDARRPSKIVARPPRVRYVVVPDYRQGQIPQLRRSLPKDRYTPCTVKQFKAMVRQALKKES
ncbi:restriction endonuclease-related protein [Nocardiopsis sp. FR6]|uniref:restriction endonuclease-related protein n=1 Tax=Nocardiopsis sp. FR6 TaxID=2605986 RepID=UPI001358112F|nr:hypothetical protein [Nocardiopsis sp. FR6]